MYTRLIMEIDKGHSNDSKAGIIEFAEGCIRFQNKEGAMIYCDNLLGKIGTLEANQFARDTRFDDWMLQQILWDMETIGQSKEQGKKYTLFPKAVIEVGSTASHVWVHLDGKRIFLIRLNK